MFDSNLVQNDFLRGYGASIWLEDGVGWRSSSRNQESWNTESSDRRTEALGIIKGPFAYITRLAINFNLVISYVAAV